ncbi:MAG: peroxiredoxin [Coprothermobacter sp.]|nr:peroxiredoxin [Coprothermobacter sp.]
MEHWQEIELVDLDGRSVRISDFQGWKVLYFYPKAMTSGCTMEAEDFSRLYEDFKTLGVTVIGVSTDNVERLKKFKEKVGIPFVLLSDPNHALAEALGVWKEKNMYGKKTMGIERSTFVINPENQIVKEWRKVKVAGHAQEVFDHIKEFMKN